jgi:OOP family OmpA-OmpF porin
MSRQTLAALCAVALLVPLNAQADDDRLYASAMFHYAMFDDAKSLEGDFGSQLSLGLPVTDKFALELTYLGRNVDVQGGGAVEQSGFGLDALWYFDGHDGDFDPYVLFGFAQITDDHATFTEDYASTQVAFGFTDDFDDNLAFRSELRVYKNDDSARGTDVALGVGLVYRFGAKPAAAAAAAPMMAPAAAPAAAAPAAVAAVPVAAVPVAAAVADADSDGDGVKDSMDKCPGTPAGRAVNADGCELDSDGDGVVDAMDKCPDTPAGTKVLANGCPVPKVVKLEGVNFTSGTATFVAGANAKLDQAVQALKDNPTIGVEIAGHTDSQGDAELNRKLSQQRADAVRKYLISGGVSPDQVTAKGYGEDEPVAGNDTADGRAQNRRVELRTKQ